MHAAGRGPSYDTRMQVWPTSQQRATCLRSVPLTLSLLQALVQEQELFCERDCQARRESLGGGDYALLFWSSCLSPLLQAVASAPRSSCAHGCSYRRLLALFRRVNLVCPRVSPFFCCCRLRLPSLRFYINTSKSLHATPSHFVLQISGRYSKVGLLCVHGIIGAT